MIYPLRSTFSARILLVEHDDSMRDALRIALEDEGYQVHPTPGPPAVEEIEDIRPDLLMLDVERHEAAGWRLVEELKSIPRMAQIPIVVSSGDGAIVAPEDVRLRSEAAAILVKPTNLDDLLPVVATALARRECYHPGRDFVPEPSATPWMGSVGY